MDVYFICLANSLKRGGRCIAGVEVTLDDERHWSVVRKRDGSPKWIRPIDKTTEFGEIMIGEAHTIPLLSVVRLTDVVPIPQQAHQEDVHYSMMSTIGRVSASASVLMQFVDDTHPVVFYGTDRAIDISTYASADHSLMFVHADTAEIASEIKEDKTRYRMLLGYNGVAYDLSVTDPDYIDALNSGRACAGIQSDVYVTLSLGLVYEERHHKLVAAVVSPTNETGGNIIIEESAKAIEIDSRPFTKAERRSIQRAFIVPSQDGLTVCFRRKNGSEDFLPLDEKSSGRAWDEVNLKRSVMITYQDEVQKLRIIHHKSWTLLDLFYKRN
jgi:hypothetical protein